MTKVPACGSVVTGVKPGNYCFGVYRFGVGTSLFCLRVVIHSCSGFGESGLRLAIFKCEYDIFCSRESPLDLCFSAFRPFTFDHLLEDDFGDLRVPGKLYTR